ncbi:hypothetical protein [Salinispora arenicola]|uniref:hypothetical protein n=1 Tax=Salinispora arenicola TaxID=168697 RepID=UPI0027DD1F7B|nr:hypothetical protein [Salinispora arenicola]
MTTQQTQGPTPTRTSRRIIGLVLATAVLLGLAVTVVLVTGDTKPELGPVQAASVTNTDAGPARCPETWHERLLPTPSAPDVMVPTGATEAVLCTYPTDGDAPWDLGATRRNTSDVTELTDYFNELATSPPHGDQACLMSLPPVRHAVVFGYPGQRSAAIHLGCVWDRDGTTRYGGDLREVTAYWGVRWNER